VTPLRSEAAEQRDYQVEQPISYDSLYAQLYWLIRISVLKNLKDRSISSISHHPQISQVLEQIS
jgi:hypothetical protein